MTDADGFPDDDGHVAVIGMAGRFPGARDTDEFWQNLAGGLDTITRDEARPLRTGTGGAGEGGAEGGPLFVPARGVLEHPEWFDAGYFGYSEDEALLLDPQARVFLECAVAALEHAGQDPDRCAGPVGVYGGSTETAHLQTVLAHRERFRHLTDDDLLLGAAPEFLASRTAERLGLRGPATTVQSACATALVAVHLAVQGLLSGDCDLALAGGVAVHVPPKPSGYSEDGILSADGVTRTFDARGDGTVASNGVGIVVLKRLRHALADGDRILAVVRGSAVTNDGSARIGFTAPSVEGQSAAVRAARLTAGVDAGTITYVEAHGTATPLGDPVEVTGLTRAFQEDTAERGYCAIGSVKSNIGHTDAAAGAAGLIKTILALEHAAIPPTLHFQEPNPQIDFASGPFRVATRYEPWQPRGGLRRAGVSAIAVGGANSHVVLEEAPAPPPTGPARSTQLLVLSARTPAALGAAAARLAAHLRTAPEPVLADVAWTLQTGRREHPCRGYVVAEGTEEAAAALVTLAEGAARTAHTGGGVPGNRPVVLVFPGSGGRPGPGRYPLAEPEYERAVAACLDALDPDLAAAVRAALSGNGPDDPGGSPDPAVHDVCAFAREYALARLWIRWGVRPAGVAGTGEGALVAAAVADVLDLPGAVRLVVARARATGSARRDALLSLVRTTGPRPPGIPLFSSWDRRWHDAAGPAPDAAWWAHEWAGDVPSDPAAADLTTVPAPSGGADPFLLRPLGEPKSESDALVAVLDVLGRLWAAGVPVDWSGAHDGARRGKVPLPGYPFERRPYLLPPPQDRPEADAASTGPHPGRDRPAPGPADATARGEAGHDSTEGGTLALVLELFRQVLGLPEVDPEDSFFDLGGDSLIAARVLAEIRERLPVEITAKSLFAAPTAVEFAEFLDERLAGRDVRTHERQA
ncbi:phosphopantetheine-binding protein [Streptomyces sp. NBC_00190]|uniref:beta-ketoacyl synthase N-terminal-like domain-containing protein n=1 Tax=unclassified Streptomyces TaxID=2593676 RepID=UPI002E2D6420|nr:beta-ketoacyl synthase N-terminal-like domain-containing protein [Streptomyces sp. NBC_00190]WSZ43366.1 phosphopantetheine-binding protein [Streptomyces sp. NBC_00868]